MAKKHQNFQKSPSSKRGDDFENLVENLERLLATGDIKIERNVRLRDIETTHGTREVDILLTAKIGETEHKIAIECRDRKKVDDITWMDALIRRREDLGLDKVIAVSKSNFSSHMIEKAKARDITLRKINPIDIAELADWLKITELKIVHYSTELHHFDIVVSGPGPITPNVNNAIRSQLQRAMYTPSEPSFYQPKSQKLVSLEDLWREGYRSNPETISDWTKKFSENKPAIFITVDQRINRVLQIPGIDGAIVKNITFKVKITQDISYASPQQPLRYQEDGVSLVDIIIFEKKVGDLTFSIDISKTNRGVAINITSSPNATINIAEDGTVFLL